MSYESFQMPYSHFLASCPNHIMNFHNKPLAVTNALQRLPEILDHNIIAGPSSQQSVLLLVYK